MLQNQALRGMEQMGVTYKVPWSTVFRRCYEKTTKGSPLRRYLVDTWDDGPIKVGDNYPQELLVDLINSLIDSRSRKQRGRLSEAELEQYFVDEEPVRRLRIKSATDITNSSPKTNPTNASTSSKRKRDDTTAEGSKSRSKNTSSNSI